MNFEQPDTNTEKEKLQQRLLEIKEELKLIDTVDKDELDQESIQLEFQIQQMKDSIAELEDSTTELQERQRDIPENMSDERKARFAEAQKIREKKNLLVEKKKEIKVTLAKLSPGYINQLADERYEIKKALGID